jgi:hypothetical protein
VDNNCWYLFGTRLKSDLSTIRPFKDNSSDPKSLDDATTSRKRLEKKTSANEKRSSSEQVAVGRKVTGRKLSTILTATSFLKTETTAAEKVDSTPWRTFPASVSVDSERHTSDSSSSKSGEAEKVRKKFALKKPINKTTSIIFRNFVFNHQLLLV